MVGFTLSCEARRDGQRSRDYLPDRAALNAQSARHGARPGLTLAPWFNAGLLRAPQPRAQEKTHGRPSRACKCAKIVLFIRIA